MEAPSNFYIVNSPKITTQFHKSQNPKRFMVWAFDDDIPCKILKKTQSGLSMCKGIELRIKDIWFPHISPKDSPNKIGLPIWGSLFSIEISQLERSQMTNNIFVSIRWKPPRINVSNYQTNNKRKTRVQLSSIAHHAPAKAHRALFHSGSNLVGLDNKSGQRKGTFSYSCMSGHTVRSVSTALAREL